ncbi:hypothetical protein PS928_05637 [Pseudomonas fluorescens]|uniref:Uncharacterized protein n=1 Tax=Pseudomonas fluorescens TaxID=294 RepID=A0A5E7VMC2_PSEFL|nr:hypothetical protein PS928_05637 [Pseudomonas fluorescens]
MTRTTQKKSNSRRGRPLLETQRALYQIKLSGWDFTWSLSLALPNNLRASEGHYHEHMILTLKGEVLYPESFKYPEVECQVYADPRMMQDINPPRGIGSMTASGRRLIVYIAVPRERIDILIGRLAGCFP